MGDGHSANRAVVLGRSMTACGRGHARSRRESRRDSRRVLGGGRGASRGGGRAVGQLPAGSGEDEGRGDGPGDPERQVHGSTPPAQPVRVATSTTWKAVGAATTNPNEASSQNST